MSIMRNRPIRLYHVSKHFYYYFFSHFDVPVGLTSPSRIPRFFNRGKRKKKTQNQANVLRSLQISFKSPQIFRRFGQRRGARRRHHAGAVFHSRALKRTSLRKQFRAIAIWTTRVVFRKKKTTTLQVAWQI